MDIDELAAEAIATLAERLATAAVDQLTGLLSDRLNATNKGARALAALRGNPRGSDERDFTAGVLCGELAHDPHFAATLIQALGLPAPQISHVTFSGHNAVRADVAGDTLDHVKRFHIRSLRFGSGGLAVLIVLALAVVLGAGYGVYRVLAPKTDALRPNEALWSEVHSVAAWHLEEFEPASRVEAVVGGFALYALDRRGQLMVIGVDAASGAVRWRQPANESWVVSGVGLYLAVHDGLAVFMSAADSKSGGQGLVQVTAVDAVTGQLRWKHATAYEVISQPAFCADDHSICLTGGVDGQIRSIVLDPATGASTFVGAAPGSRMVSEELIAEDEGPDLIRMTVDGKQVWRRTASAIFSAPVSADYGWHILRRDGRYVGMLGSPWQNKSQNLQTRRMAGFDERTGAPLWSVEGTWPCASIEFSLQQPVRCRGTGTVSISDSHAISLDGQIDVEGFDPASGVATWSWAAGNVLGLVSLDDSVRRIDTNRYVIDTASGPIVLDVATGSHQVADAATPMWCENETFITPAGGNAQRRSEELRVVQHWPCRQDGSVSGSPTTIGDFAGARSGDVYAWTAPDGLRAAAITR